ncbi:MAG: hypothetical protein M3Q69_17130, partial [Acidobacteriota bacterium]|nr:hypothetical protein [Acidobacteriota bacterium]
MTVHATSLSVYRGQSRSGDGEGPGQAILRGEQYLHVDRELYESELLDAIRSWMTLDSDPLDHQRLNDRLESWSLFSLRDYLFVVRLVSAGRYDQRAAYFSHARVWKRSSLPRTFDPGLNLGRETAFAQPWRDQDAVPPEALETLSSLVRPQQIKEEAETASLFLAHLFQTMTQQSALIITAPVAEFASGSALHALVSFARGGLPAEVRDPCRIRVYSRIPDKFLRHLGTHLLVVPEPAAADAVAARSSATLLDRRGNKVMGKDLDPRFLDYARWVVERATALPDGLAQFSARYAFRPHEFAPGESARASVQITYNVASALTAGEHKALMTYLPSAATAFGPGLDWNRFIADDAWQQFPRELLLDRLLSSSDAAAEGERELLRTIAAKASRLG